MNAVHFIFGTIRFKGTKPLLHPITLIMLILLSLGHQARGDNGIAAANISVVQLDTGNTQDSVNVTMTMSINDFRLRGSNRGDYDVQVGTDFADDVTSGVLISCVAENGRNNGEVDNPGINYCTSSIDYARTGDDEGGYFIPIFNAPAADEYNINVAAAFFSYNKWLGGFARNSVPTNGGPNDLFTGSSGLVLGTHFIDQGGGHSIVDLRSFGIDSRTDGVLLVAHGKNEDNYAMSQANSTNGTWNVFVKDNGTDAGSYEQDPVAFVYIPRTNNSVICGKFRGDGARLIVGGLNSFYSVVNTGAGTWRLTIPGQTPNSGVLIISPEGGASQNQDNIISYEPDDDGWIIQSRDLPGNPPGLQTPSSGTEPVASFVFIPSIAPTLVSPTASSTNLGTSPTLKVAVSNALAADLTVKFYGRLTSPPNTNKDFTVVVLPDTQNYSGTDNGGVPGMFTSQTDWIIANRTNLNIAFVSHLGDITQRGQNGGNNVEWLVATNAMYRLENPINTLLSNGIPYGLAVGNHDQQPRGGGDTADTTFFNQFFGVNHFIGYDYYGGHYGGNNDNSFQFFSAGGMDFIIIHFEYDTTPLATVLTWANNLLKTYPNHRAIVSSHHIVNTGFNATFSAQGQAIYNTLRTNANLFLMVNGHISGEGQRSDVFQGHTVYSILTDYQGRTNGGDGWLRYYTFSPSNNVIRAFTYSPWLNKQENDANSRFNLPYDMSTSGPGFTNSPFALLGTKVITSSNSIASLIWTNLQPGKIYEWYVVVNDEQGNVATGPTWDFTAGTNTPPTVVAVNRTFPGDSPTNLALVATDINGDALTFELTSSPTHGVVKNFDQTNGIITYLPVHGYRGPDQFTYRARDYQTNGASALINLTIIAPPDANANGLPDSWETMFGLNDPNSDPDGDGQNNLNEFFANTNPTNSSSALKITNAVRAANGHITLTWPTVGGSRYRIQFSNATINGGFTGVFTDIIRPIAQEMDASPLGQASTQTFLDDFTKTGGPPAGGTRYYRIQVVY